MEHELKIVLRQTPQETFVFVDNRPISLIQDIKFHTNVDNPATKIEERQLKLFKEIPYVKIIFKDLFGKS